MKSGYCCADLEGIPRIEEDRVGILLMEDSSLTWQVFASSVLLEPK